MIKKLLEAKKINTDMIGTTTRTIILLLSLCSTIAKTLKKDIDFHTVKYLKTTLHSLSPNSEPSSGKAKYGLLFAFKEPN